MASPESVQLSVEGRPVAVRLYRGSGPWVLFSTGFGGARGDYGALARHWSLGGYQVAVVAHPGSDRRALMALAWRRLLQSARRLRARVHTAEAMRHRPADLRALADALGLTGYVAAGHSFGSYTALALGGAEATLPDGSLGDFADPRVQAVVALSPHPPGLLFAPGAYASVVCPTLLVTGSRDHDAGTGLDYRTRLQVLGYLGGPGLAVGLEGLRHLDVAEFLPGSRAYRPALQTLTTAFLDWALQGRPQPTPPQAPAICAWEVRP